MTEVHLRESRGPFQLVSDFLNCLNVLPGRVQRRIGVSHVDVHAYLGRCLLFSYVHIRLPSMVRCWINIFDFVIVPQNLQMVAQPLR